MNTYAVSIFHEKEGFKLTCWTFLIQAVSKEEAEGKAYRHSDRLTSLGFGDRLLVSVGDKLLSLDGEGKTVVNNFNSC